LILTRCPCRTHLRSSRELIEKKEKKTCLTMHSRIAIAFLTMMLEFPAMDALRMPLMALGGGRGVLSSGFVTMSEQPALGCPPLMALRAHDTTKNEGAIRCKVLVSSLLAAAVLHTAQPSAARAYMAQAGEGALMARVAAGEEHYRLAFTDDGFSDAGHEGDLDGLQDTQAQLAFRADQVNFSLKMMRIA
jgi:hypothetical protein